MRKIFLSFVALVMCATMWAEQSVDTLYLNTGGSSLWNQAGAKFSVWYWNDGEQGHFTDFLELANGETDIYRAIIPKSDSVIFVRHNATADVPTWDNKWNQTKNDEVDLEIGNIMVITGWEPADREWDYYTPKEPEPTKIFAKNNWDEAKDWTWKEMTHDSTTIYSLVDVFGGTGININSKKDDASAKWFKVEDIKGDKIAAGDTIQLVFNLADSTLEAVVVGRPAKPVYDTVQYVAGNFTHWKSEMKALPYAITLPKDSTLEFKQVRVITTKDSDTKEVIKKDTTWYGQATKDFYMTRENVGKGWKLDGEHNVLLTTDVAGEYTFKLNGENFIVEFPEKAVQIFAKNQWNGGDWSWKAMQNDSLSIYSLDSVVYGGVGININTKEDDGDALWFDAAKMKYTADSIKANDTVKIVFDKSDSTLTATLLGRPEKPCTGEFGIIVNGVYHAGVINPGQKEATEYMVRNVLLNEGDSLQLYDNCSKSGWADGVEYMENSYEFPRKNNKFVVNATDSFDFYFQLGTPDKLYIKKGTPELDIFAKNNWNGATEWTWKKMTKTADKVFALDSVVYGGTGVNINDHADDQGSTFYDESKIKYIGDSIKANDTILLVYNLNDTTLTATLLGRPVPPAPVEVKYYIAGNMTDWKKNMVELTKAAEDSLYRASIALLADSVYEYKVVSIQGTDTAWYGMDGAGTMTYGNCTGWWIYKSVDKKNQCNVGLQTTKAADYAFAVDVRDVANKIIVSVAIPEPAPQPVKIFAKNNWDGGEWTWKEMTHDSATIYSLVAVFGGTGININNKADDQDALYYSVDKIGGDSIAAGDTIQLAFSLADSTLDAAVLGRPYIPVYHYDTTMYVAGSFTNWKAGMLRLPESIELPKDSTIEFKQVRVIDKMDGYTVVKADTTWFGTPGTTPMTRDNSTWLLDGDNNVTLTADVAGIYKFEVIATGEFKVTWPEQPSGLKAVQANGKETKVLVNGQLYIIREGVWYNTTGARIK